MWKRYSRTQWKCEIFFLSFFFSLFNSHGHRAGNQGERKQYICSKYKFLCSLSGVHVLLLIITAKKNFLPSNESAHYSTRTFSFIPFSLMEQFLVCFSFLVFCYLQENAGNVFPTRLHYLLLSVTMLGFWRSSSTLSRRLDRRVSFAASPLSESVSTCSIIYVQINSLQFIEVIYFHT